MSTLHIKAEDRDGTVKDLQIEENPSSNLMEALTEEGYDIPAICGGMAGCGTCHITVSKGYDGLRKPEEDEEFMLDSLPNLTDHSRLSCQVALTSAIDGIELKVLGDGM
ncbi:MAG: 2Fe-2S iron-sulfur cluster-binding protein [Bacteroidota bacterium]